MELEEHHRIRTWPAVLGIAVLHPVADKREIKLLLQMSVEVVLGDQRLEGGEDGTVEIAELGWAEHGGGLGGVLHSLVLGMGDYRMLCVLEPVDGDARRNRAHIQLARWAIQ
jgi:hypothetical protein